MRRRIVITRENDEFFSFYGRTGVLTDANHIILDGEDYARVFWGSSYRIIPIELPDYLRKNTKYKMKQSLKNTDIVNGEKHKK